MVRNIGKVFEDEIKESVNNEHWFYRFKDGTSAYNRSSNSNIRFQASNICDCQVMGQEYLYLLELKTTKKCSFPIVNIRKNQLEGLAKVNHKKIKQYFIICFREPERCYAIEAVKLKKYIESTHRKSIPILWCKENGIDIPMQKKKVRYKYDLSELIL